MHVHHDGAVLPIHTIAQCFIIKQAFQPSLGYTRGEKKSGIPLSVEFFFSFHAKSGFLYGGEKNVQAKELYVCNSYSNLLTIIFCFVPPPAAAPPGMTEGGGE